MLSTTRQHGLNGLNLQNTFHLNAALIRACQEHELGCYCWTVDNPRRAAALIKNGINGIATNRPGWMRKQLNATGAL